MTEVRVRFFGGLNDFLPAWRQATASSLRIDEPTTVGEVIEALGVPPSDVDVVTVDGESVSFRHRILGGEWIGVYPAFEALDVRGAARLPSRPLRETKFVVDRRLSQLARRLTHLGFDTWFDESADDDTVVRTSRREQRILLTPDGALLDDVTHGVFIRGEELADQLREVLNRLDLPHV